MIEVVAIGNEVLSGQTVNSNAAFISKELFQRGYPIIRHTSVADEPQEIEKGLEEALGRARVVIATGGLGPTLDDLTGEVAAKLFNSEIHTDEEVKRDLINRFGDRLTTLEHQSRVPDKAQAIKNRIGTAPGLVFRQGDKLLFLLPGVPLEMKSMLLEDVIPLLEKEISVGRFHKRILHFCLLKESEVDPLLRQLAQEYPEVSFGIYPQFGTLSVSLSSRLEDRLLKPAETLKKAFEKYFYEAESIEEAVHKKLIAQKKTLSLAESCTGGNVSKRLTAISGASLYYQGGLVCYSNLSKFELLGVPQDTLDLHGAVSKETVEAMVVGAMRIFHTDYSLAVTGVAGPDGGSPQKPVGTVFCAIGFKDRPPYIWKLTGAGSREAIIDRASTHLLAEFYLKI